MYSLEALIMFVIAGTLAGLIIGVLLGLRRSPAVKAADLEKQLSAMQQEQEDYQHQVTQHFSETAQLLDQLTNSYRDVHNHLAQGAQTLCDSESISQAIEQLPGSKPQIEADVAPLDDDTPRPPLDYAPRQDPAAKGVLDEEFGLEKKTGM